MVFLALTQSAVLILGPWVILLSTSTFDLLRRRLVWLLAGSISVCYLRRRLYSYLLWWGLCLILLFSFAARSIFFFYLIFELRLIPIALIILYNGRQPERLSSIVYFLMYTCMLSIPCLVLILLCLPGVFFVKGAFFLVRRGFSALFMLPFLVKIPVFGLHFWLPKAHVEARTRGSMVLAGLLLKLGGYGVIRLYVLMIRNFFFYSGIWIVGAVLSRVITFLQSDIKKLIAYRRITHMTFLVVGLLSNRKIAFIRTILLSLAHGWASIGMFFSGGIFRHSTLSRVGVVLSSEIRLHLIPLCLGMLLLVNASIPPMPSFFPEIGLMVVISRTRILLFWLFVLLRFLVCYYNTYFFILISQIKASSNFQIRHSFYELEVYILLFIASLISLGFLIKL